MKFFFRVQSLLPYALLLRYSSQPSIRMNRGNSAKTDAKGKKSENIEEHVHVPSLISNSTEARAMVVEAAVKMGKEPPAPVPARSISAGCRFIWYGDLEYFIPPNYTPGTCRRTPVLMRLIIAYCTTNFLNGALLVN